MTAHRPKDFTRVSSTMLMRLEGSGLKTAEKVALVRLAKGADIDQGVPWGDMRKLVNDVLRMINDKRKRDGRVLMDEAELRKAARFLLKGIRKEPLFEELSDALSVVREARLGVRKIPPLNDDDIKKIA